MLRFLCCNLWALVILNLQICDINATSSLKSSFATTTKTTTTTTTVNFTALNPNDYAQLVTDDAGNHLDWAIDNVPFIDFPDKSILEV